MAPISLRVAIARAYGKLRVTRRSIEYAHEGRSEFLGLLEQYRILGLSVHGEKATEVARKGSM